MELADLLEADELDEIAILAIAPETTKEAKKVAEELGANASRIQLLSDPTGKVIRQYGLLNEKKKSRNLPHPTTLVIDGEGKIQWRFTEVDYKIRPSNADVRKALEGASRKDSADR